MDKHRAPIYFRLWLSPARGASPRAISHSMHRPGAGSGTRPTSEVHLQAPPSLPHPSPHCTEILDDNTDRWSRPHTPRIQICLLSFFATFRPFGSCDRLSLWCTNLSVCKYKFFFLLVAQSIWRYIQVKIIRVCT